MHTYNPELKKHIKKRKIYNVGPLVTVENIDTVETGLDIFMALKDVKDVWYTFLHKHISKGELLPFPFEEQLQLILLISNNNMQTQIVKKLRSIKTYNPNIDPIPISELPQNLSSYINKRKEELLSIKKDFNNNLFVKNNIIGIYTEREYSEQLVYLYKYFNLDLFVFANNDRLIMQFNPQKTHFYEIKGKNINIDSLFLVLNDYNGKPEIKDTTYIMKNNLNQGELIELIKDNIE